MNRVIRENLRIPRPDRPWYLAQAFRNVETALAAAGLTPADVVKLNYYVVDLDPEKVAQFGAGVPHAARRGQRA